MPKKIKFRDAIKQLQAFNNLKFWAERGYFATFEHLSFKEIDVSVADSFGRTGTTAEPRLIHKTWSITNEPFNELLSEPPIFGERKVHALKMDTVLNASFVLIPSQLTYPLMLMIPHGNYRASFDVGGGHPFYYECVDEELGYWAMMFDGLFLLVMHSTQIPDFLKAALFNHVREIANSASRHKWGDYTLAAMEWIKEESLYLISILECHTQSDFSFMQKKESDK